MYYKIKLFFDLADSLFVHHLPSVMLMISISSGKSFTLIAFKILCSPMYRRTRAVFLFVGVGGGYGGGHLVVAVVGHDQVIVFIPVDIVFVTQAFFV